MVLHLAGRGGVSVSPELRARIEAKIAKLQRLFPKLIEARVVLATERYRHLAEVTLQAKRATFHVEGEAAGFHAAVDQALAALSAQIRRRKERVTAKKARPPRTRPRGAAGRPGSPAEPADETPAGGAAVTVRRTNAKPMSLEEAVDQLRLQTDGLLVFRNARTRAVNVLRRRARRDGGACRAQPARAAPPRAGAGRAAAPHHHHRTVRGREELGHQVLRGHGLLLRGQPADHADPHVRRALRPLDPPHRPHRARRGHPGARVPRTRSSRCWASFAPPGISPRCSSWRPPRRPSCGATTRPGAATRCRRASLLDGIREERKLLANLRELADRVIDTSADHRPPAPASA